jgi:hypothetical protein
VRTIAATGVLVVLAIQLFSHTDTARTWQDREHARTTCGLAATADRQDLMRAYCGG